MIRRWLRDQFLRVFDRVLSTDEGRRMVVETLRGSLAWRPDEPRVTLPASSPYPQLDWHGEPVGVPRSRAPIFITSRFRSGSTLLWNIFRHLKGVTAYYEPLNERRWFDAATRGAHTDASHRKVADYWREYDGLDVLANWYQEHWIRRDLYMGAGAWDNNLFAYLSALIDHADGRAVLQFNRVDFRLPWLRRQFPSAQIVHLYRHPRDQWCSCFLRHLPFPTDGAVAEFAARDEFYLLAWARDLAVHFPFLDESAASHPYQLFYYIWRLSHAFGRTYADASLSFEDLVVSPRETLERLFANLNVSVPDWQPLVGLIDAPRLDRWREYADDGWFGGHEARCERELSRFFATEASSEPAIGGPSPQAVAERRRQPVQSPISINH